jgi:hypothetical protein
LLQYKVSQSFPKDGPACESRRQIGPQKRSDFLIVAD